MHSCRSLLKFKSMFISNICGYCRTAWLQDVSATVILCLVSILLEHFIGKPMAGELYNELFSRSTVAFNVEISSLQRAVFWEIYEASVVL